MSVISSLLPFGSRVLDLGCGPRDQAIPIEHLGYSYVGLDFTNQSADFLADAHSIPFMDASFDCVFSYAVFEHLHNPYVAIQEVSRVLKPEGVFIGGVSQGEPFHQSYFHLTPWGFVSLIYSVQSLRITRLWPSMDTLQSLSRIGRYPRVIRFLIKQIDSLHKGLPFLAPRKVKWPRRDKALDELYRAGSLAFCVMKSQDG
jgi:SAM-dependent methyltransferase